MKSAKEKSQRKIFIYAIAAIDKQKQDKVLRTFLGQFGQLQNLILDAQNGCFAIAEFEKKESVDEILKFREHKIGLDKIQVSPYKDRRYQHEEKRRSDTYNGPKEDEVMEQILRATDMKDQLKNLIEVLRLEDEDIGVRNNICAFLEKTLSPFFEMRCRVYQFGSSINNFGAKGCDLDIFVDFQSEDNVKMKKGHVTLPYHRDIKSVKFDYGPITQEQYKSIVLYDRVKLISRILSRKKTIISDCMSIPSRRCPIVKFKDCISDISCDLSINNKKALYNSKLLRLYSTNPVVRQVVVAVRHWAKVQEISGASGSGISSYALTFMVLFFLMRRKPPIIPLVWDIPKYVAGVQTISVDSWRTLDIPMDAQLPCSNDTATAVDLLKEFFQFYANEIDWEEDVLLTSNATITPQSSFLASSHVCTLSFMNMVDPFVLSHNVLSSITEKLKHKFVVEVMRAAELSQKWSKIPSASDSNVWGIATIFVPNPDAVLPPNGTTGKGDKRKKALTEGGGKGNFVFNIIAENSILSAELFLARAKNNLQSVNEFWCNSVQTMLLDILSTALMATLSLEHEKVEKESEEENRDIKRDTEPGKNEETLFECDISESEKKGISMMSSVIAGSSEAIEKQGSDQLCIENLKGNNSKDCSFDIIDQKQSTEDLPINAVQKSEAPDKKRCFPAGISQYISNKTFGMITNTPNIMSCHSKRVNESFTDLQASATMHTNDETSVSFNSGVKRSSSEAGLDEPSAVQEKDHDLPMMSGEQIASSSQKQNSSASPMKKKKHCPDEESTEAKANEKREFILSSVCGSSQASSNTDEEMCVLITPKPEKDLRAEAASTSSLILSEKEDNSTQKTVYSCICPSEIWRDRNKVRQTLDRNKGRNIFHGVNKPNGLALEREISRIVLGVKIDGGKQEHQTKLFSQGSKDNEELKFTCEITKIFNTEVPRIIVVFHPRPEQVNSFKNFFSCASSMMKRLVSSHLLDEN